MNKFKFLVCILLAAPVCCAFAQSEKDFELINTNVDENGKHIRGSYLTNPWYSNWSVGIAGGVQTLVSGTGAHNKGMDFGTARITPELELNLTKWFTPVIATRFGLQGFWLEEEFQPRNLNHYSPKIEDGITYMTQTYLHLDVMWNFVNTFWGYRGNRFYNVVPYVQGGYLRLCHPDHSLFTNEYRDREFVLGFGIYNTFRLAKALQATIDLRWGSFSGRYHDAYDGGTVTNLSASVGLAYNIEKWYWIRSKGIEMERDEAKAQALAALAALDAARSENDALKALIDELNKKCNAKVVEQIPAKTFRERVDNADLIMYYEINVSKPNFAEINHLNDFVTDVMAKDPKHVFYLTGSADKGTGTFEINTRLSRERAEGVRDLLINKYHIPEEQVIIKATIISDKHEDGGLDRCVLIEKE